MRAYAYARRGQPEKAHEILRELLDIESSGDYLQPYFVARIYAGLNEKDKALEWLDLHQPASGNFALCAPAH